MTKTRYLALIGAACVAAAGMGSADQAASDRALRQAMLAAEDARARTPEERAPLVTGLAHRDPAIRRTAVRGLGRLEDPSLAEHIAPLLADGDAAVRGEAANALAQGVVRSPGEAGPSREALAARLRVETDADVVGAICASVGRLPYSSASDVQIAERLLVEVASRATSRVQARPSGGLVGVSLSFGPGAAEVPRPVLTGAVKGLESLFRLRRKIATPSPDTIERLTALVTARAASGQPSRAAARANDRLRLLALGALVAASAADAPLLAKAAEDPDWQVRRLAVNAAGNPAGGVASESASDIVRRAMVDPSANVRFEAVRAAGRLVAPGEWNLLLRAFEDENAHVALAAIDAMPQLVGAAPDRDRSAGNAVDRQTLARGAEQVVTVLAEIAGRLPVAAGVAGGRSATPGGGWHQAAHALEALSRLSRNRAAALLPRFTSHPVWQVRMYAVRAAARIADGSARTAPDAKDRETALQALDALAADRHANVREAAISGLARARGHEADHVLIAALESPDYQLVMTAARALAGSPNRADAVPALLTALARLTAENRDTSRDPRRAILERLRELGSTDNATALAPYLADIDPAIAALAAETLTRWTGQPHRAKTTRMRTGAPPDLGELDALGMASAVVTMRGGASFTLRLFPDEAPATVLRFVRLARAGHYNGLTFHRVEPNFVIQGGSPGANEYVGDGPYMRDEVGLLSHVRGTVGISTRGRDTGDAQIFVNLVDNPRLDHDYTVFAEVVRGIEVVDRIVEGDVIEKIAVAPGRP